MKVYVNGRTSFNLASNILPFSTPTQTEGLPIYTATVQNSLPKRSYAKHSRNPIAVFEKVGAVKFAGIKENLPLVQSKSWKSTLSKPCSRSWANWPVTNDGVPDFKFTIG